MLIPKEHGAYGQLLIPLVVALLVGRPTTAAAAVTASGVAAFLAHEAVLVLLGQRGMRARREQQGEARRSLAVFGSVALVAGCLGVAFLPIGARVSLIVPLGLALVATILVAIGRERTTVGEVLVAVTLVSVSLPAAMAGGVSARSAGTIAAVFSASFASATLAVRAVIAYSTRQAHGVSRWTAVIVITALLSALVALAAARVVAAIAPWAAAPVFGLAVALVATMPSPRRLRVVGWTLVGATLTTAVVLIVALRVAALR